MARWNPMIVLALLVALSVFDQLEAFSLHGHKLVKRTADADILQRIQTVGNLNFNSTVVARASERRRIACFFVFDKEASADLRNNPENAKQYANQLVSLTSRYTAHANIVVTNAGVELWSTGDKISFAVGSDPTSAMPDFLTRFQEYLEKSQKAKFGKEYALGVLISQKPTVVAGGYSQGPLCTTSGASLLNYRPIPWSIAGLLAHELAHTLSVVHPFELTYLCQDYPKLKFCASSVLPTECTCDSATTPPEQCLMTFAFGRAKTQAPRYTPCDIEMMTHFSSNVACLAQ